MFIAGVCIMNAERDNDTAVPIGLSVSRGILSQWLNIHHPLAPLLVFSELNVIKKFKRAGNT